MCKCIGGMLLTLMSCLTLGICLAASIVMLIIVETKDIPDVTKDAEIILIVVLVVVALVFIFAIYASCCGKIVARRILSAIFIILAIGLLVIAILIFTLTDKTLDEVGKYWEEGENHDQEIVDEIESALKCCGYDSDKGCAPNTERCKDKLDSQVHDIAYAIAIILIIVVVLLIISAIIGCLNKCAPREKIESEEQYP